MKETKENKSNDKQTYTLEQLILKDNKRVKIMFFNSFESRMFRMLEPNNIKDNSFTYQDCKYQLEKPTLQWLDVDIYWIIRGHPISLTINFPETPDYSKPDKNGNKLTKFEMIWSDPNIIVKAEKSGWIKALMERKTTLRDKFRWIFSWILTLIVVGMVVWMYATSYYGGL